MVHTQSLLLVVAAAMFAVTLARVSDRRGPLNLSFSKMAVYPEDSCSQEGGMCLDKDECSEGKLLRRGLCKEQQKRGVECCAGNSVSLSDCAGVDGHCDQ